MHRSPHFRWDNTLVDVIRDQVLKLSRLHQPCRLLISTTGGESGRCIARLVQRVGSTVEQGEGPRRLGIFGKHAVVGQRPPSISK
jgi:hypothetical protein